MPFCCHFGGKDQDHRASAAFLLGVIRVIELNTYISACSPRPTMSSSLRDGTIPSLLPVFFL